jgi:hypothetical protein
VKAGPLRAIEDKQAQDAKKMAKVVKEEKQAEKQAKEDKDKAAQVINNSWLLLHVNHVQPETALLRVRSIF